MIDVAIIGGGPAGLAAALTLARARRTAAVIDAGHPRNAASRGLRGYLTRDGVLPGELLRLGWAEVLSYPDVRRIEGYAATARRMNFDRGFEVDVTDGKTLRSRKLLLATGVVDELPDVPGLRELYGDRVFHCPYCDGYEYADRPLLLYASSTRAYEGARFLRNWSRKLTVLTDGQRQPRREHCEELERIGVRCMPERIESVRPWGPGLAVTFKGGEAISADALFFNTPSFGKSALAEQLGVKVDREGAIKTKARGRTSVTGLYAAGNVLRDVMLTQVAAGQGVEAAFALVGELVDEDFKTEKEARR